MRDTSIRDQAAFNAVMELHQRGQVPSLLNVARVLGTNERSIAQRAIRRLISAKRLERNDRGQLVEVRP